MTRSSWTRLPTALALALALPATCVLPAEHVHPGDGDHAPAFAHRHAAFHDDGDDDHDHGALAVSHGEDHVTWLPEIFLGQATFAHAAPAATIPAVYAITGETVWISTWRPAISGQPHGPPPQPQLLRGPPPFCLI